MIYLQIRKLYFLVFSSEVVQVAMNLNQLAGNSFCAKCNCLNILLGIILGVLFVCLYACFFLTRTKLFISYDKITCKYYLPDLVNNRMYNLFLF